MENYKKLLEKAQKAYKNCVTGAEKRRLESIFPELKENEDEMIREEIVDYLKGFIPHHDDDLVEKSKVWIKWLLEKQKNPSDKGEISDGYHTFNELYYYRMLYNAAFFNSLPKDWVHKSKKHHDGEECFGGGWFIVMANLPTGQISNHYELKNWDLFQIPEKEIADEWDGHTPGEAAERIHKFLLERQGEQNPTLSEEDEKMFDSIIEDVMPCGECPDYPTDEEREYFYEGDRKVKWLKSLKERIKNV